jgi:hypothetical protein
LRLRISWSIYLSILFAFMTWTGTTLPLTFKCFDDFFNYHCSKSVQYNSGVTGGGSWGGAAAPPPTASVRQTKPQHKTTQSK